MSEWKEYKLGDFLKVKHGYAFKGENIVTEETPNILVTPGNFNIGGGFKSDKFKYYKGDEFPKEYILTSGDIVVTMTDLSKDSDTLGYSAKIPYSTNHNYLHNQRIGLVQFVNENVCKDFVYWLMRTREYQNYIVGSASGTSIMHTSPSRIEDYRCLIPSSLSEQERIASILSSLDDKIDLLHRENKTLEAMAETLFRQWFVEEAKEDWKEVSLTKVANFLNGLACQKYPPKNEIEKLPVLKIRELSNGIGKDCDWATTDIANEYIVSNGDVIFAWSASLMVKIWDGEECVLNQHLFKVTSDKYPKWFYYFWCKYHLDEFITIAQSHATTMGHIKRKDLENAMVLVPTDNELKTMSKQIESLLQKIENNNNEIKTLTQTRDSLLPKLMCGEIKV
jgi:type I restriction enzyme S subunit